MNSPYRSRDEEEMSKPFKARPMPSPRRQLVSAGPGRKLVTLTEARPFHLRSEERGRAKQAILAQKLLIQQNHVRSPAAVEGFGTRPLATYGCHVDLLLLRNRERFFVGLFLFYCTILCYGRASVVFNNVTDLEDEFCRIVHAPLKLSFKCKV